MNLLRLIRNDFNKRVCNERGTWALWAGIIGTTVLLAGAGTAGTSLALSGGNVAKKAKESEDERRKKALRQLETGVPKPEDASAKARTAAAKKRRIIQLAGGQTLLTTETPLGESGQKTLLGG